MAYSQTNRPLKLNLDKIPSALKEDEASYLLNHERNVTGESGSIDDSTPMPANYPGAQLIQPAGENYAVFTHEDKITNEEYSGVYNSNGSNRIQRYTDKNGLEIVYDGECLKFSPDPKHAVEQFRAILRLDPVYDKDGSQCKNRHGKHLIWTDGLYAIGCIDVEASIATNSFTTPFFDICPDPCAMIQLCVPEPCDVIIADFLPRTKDDIGLSNKLLQQSFKFRFRWVYYDLRASEWSEISKPYFLDEKGCFQDIDSLSRCMQLRIPLGNPMVEKIEIAYSVGDKGDLTVNDGYNDMWRLYDTIEKYKKYNNSQEKWYERSLSEVVTDTLDLQSCTFLYTFCNDISCTPINFKETSRVYNPMPIQPQGILRVKENNIGFYNYRSGNCPVDLKEISKVKLNVNCQDDACETEYATVTVRAIINEVRGNTNQWVYRLGGVMGNTDDPTDTAYYGAAPNGIITYIDNPLKNMCGQSFNDARNFTAYIEGTPYYAEMKQWKANVGFINRSEYGIVSGMGPDQRSSRKVPFYITNEGFFYQEAIFRVPKGTRGIIRLKAPSSRSNDASTSASIYGLLPLKQYTSSIFSGTNWRDIYKADFKEIEFDTCNGNIVFDDAFLILSVNGYDHLDALPGGDDRDEYLYDGYVTDKNNDPVAGCLIYTGSNLMSITDYNGYYSFFGTSTQTIDFKVEQDCGSFKTIKTLVIVGNLNGVKTTDYKIEAQDYIDRFSNIVNVSVLDCQGATIKGITIAIREGKATVTDSNTGIASFIVRNNYTRDKKVRAYVMDRNGCFINGCNNECNPCMPQTDLIHLVDCFASTSLVTNLVANERVNTRAINGVQKFLKRGGRYLPGVVFKGDCGRISPVYRLPYIDIPKMQSTITSGPCLLSYDARGLVAPSWANCMKIVRTENMNNYELQWVVDKIQKTGDNKILLTIQSLNDYNENYFFETNTSYQWLKGDRVEFVWDEKGKIIDASVHGILNYLTISPFQETLLSNRNDPGAKYFNQLVIEDDGRIDFLKEGSVIEIQRAKACDTEPIFFAIASIPIHNGRLIYEQGTFETFDTYIKKRIINESFFQIFEHHSPSDFWGNRLTDAGSAHFENLYENEKRHGRYITINAADQFNYFGDLVKKMPATQQGDIIAMDIKDGRVILAICENDNLMAMSADDLLRIGNGGIVTAIGIESIIGNPEAKISGEFGCRYSDIGSIFFGDGFATWYDGNKYKYVKHDYQMAVAVDTDKAQTFFRKIGTKMDFINKTASDLDKIRWCTGFNYLTGAIQLTNKSLRHSGFNNDKELYQSPNVTILFDPASGDFLTLVGYTPERYSHVTLNDGFGCAFLSYLNGVPYIHPVVPGDYNEFFGVATDRVITIAINKYEEKERIPLAFELQSQMMYFVHSVKTSDSNFLSEIPPIKVKGYGGKWNAGFLRNINSVGGLFKGKEANDFWISVTFVRDNTVALEYGSIDDQKRIKFDSLGEILFRFQMSEQSGFPELNKK